MLKQLTGILDLILLIFLSRKIQLTDNRTGGPAQRRVVIND